jgi:DNA mismatch repair protein MutS2
MAQSGLPVPAAEAEFPIFGQVLADIGDNQSIQESLSTFSAHISHIREMALDVTPDSLVLLDELGAAPIPRKAARWAWPSWNISAPPERTRWHPRICWR